VIPARCATFFTPCWLRPSALAGCGTLCCSSRKQPKVLLAPAAPLPAMALATESRAFEAYDFSPGHDIQLGQVRQHKLVIRRAGELNCLGCFLWVDLGVGRASPATARQPPPRAVGSHVGEGDLACRFPFGHHAAFPADEGASRSLNQFTSLCSEATVRDATYASNWQNHLLLLPKPTPVRPGDVLSVTSRVAAGRVRPTYEFELSLQPVKDGAALRPPPVSLGKLLVTFDDLYPDYGDVC